MARIVLIAGFESFNIDLYRKATALAAARCPSLDIHVFSERDLTSTRTIITEALIGANVFFASLIFDYDQVMWPRDRRSIVN
jgi:magnesium chelatase subunit H